MMDDHDSGHSEKLTFNRFRNALLLSYLALSGAALAYTYASLKSAEGLVVFLVFMGAIPLLAVIVVAYLCSLALAGILKRCGLPLRSSIVAGIVAGPVSAVMAIMFIRWFL